MAAVAAYAASDGGKMAWLVSQATGTDPAAGVPDPLVALNMRAAMMVMSNRPTPELTFEEKYG